LQRLLPSHNGNKVASNKEGDGKSGKSNDAGKEEGNGDGSKSNGDGNKEGKGGKGKGHGDKGVGRGTAMLTKRAMATATRVVGNEECTGNRFNCNSNKGGGRQKGQ
jgi:hypothetical protein